MEYKECFEIMGNDHPTAIQNRPGSNIHADEDHMMNGQLKPAYNVQIAVENYFVSTGI